VEYLKLEKSKLLKLQEIFNISDYIRFGNKFIFSRKKFNIEDTILIVGTPRSGTTWFSEILLTIPGYAYLFEPLDPLWFPASFKAGFRSKTYLSQDVEWNRGEEYLRKTLTGQINSLLPLYLPLLKPKMIFRQLLGDKLIVKFVNLNRLLPWVNKKFKVGKIFFIIRHPCAVVNSQLKKGFCGYRPASPPFDYIFPSKEQILKELLSIEGLDSQLINKMKNISSIEEILAVSWCIDNYIPLSIQKPYPFSIITYEKLVKDGKKEIIKIFNELGEKNISSSTFRYLDLPSISTRKKDLNRVTNMDEQLSNWKKTLSDQKINKILKIVNDFGLDFYSNDLEPRYNKLYI